MVLEQRRSLLPGTRFGRYEVLADIAAGGMAMVYLGRALGAAGFQRLVAIKVMHAQYAHDQDFVAMFLDEARLAARIHHPNVVPTLDLENDQDGLYLVMEYVEGDTLLQLLRQSARAGQRIPQPVAIRVALDMLAGLHAAHELTDELGHPLHLVHRDVSPHNVLVGLDGIARITDFGIARAEERFGTTRNGQVKGKLSYMAPEQTTSEVVTRRADLFTTGVVLWESLAGRRLFNGQTDGEVYRKLVETPIPRLSSVLADVPPVLDDVIARALARDPADRFESGAEFAEALESAASAITIASPRVVGQLVQQIAGERLETVRARVREARVSNPDGTGPVSAVRAVTGRGSFAPAVASVPPTAIASVPPQAVEAPSSKRVVAIAVAAALIAVVGSTIGVVLALKHAPREVAPRPPAPSVPAAVSNRGAAVETAMPTATLQPAAGAASAVDAGVVTEPAADHAVDRSTGSHTPTARTRTAGANGSHAPTASPPANAAPSTNGSGSRTYNPEWM
jgi:serine/threonine-protein kinase